jgi:hypothetical protein
MLAFAKSDSPCQRVVDGCKSGHEDLLQTDSEFYQVQNGSKRPKKGKMGPVAEPSLISDMSPAKKGMGPCE